MWSCLEGCTGSAFAVGTPPVSALLQAGDFCFYVGRPDAALARFVPLRNVQNGVFLVPQTAQWAHLLTRAWPESEALTRCAFQKRNDCFDKSLLWRMAVPPAPCYVLRPIDEPLYRALLREDWSRDLCAQFDSWPAYAAHGMGFAVLHAGRPVCGASSYTFYSGGIEIELDTKPTYRGRGLARACASKLVLDCLEKGLHPSWDAANPVSAHIARTLGYRPAGTYTVYAVRAGG